MLCSARAFDLGQSPQIGPKRLGDLHRSVDCLVVLQKRDDRARQGHTGAVQGVDSFDLSVLVVETDPCAARLKILEIAARGNFEPLVEPGGIGNGISRVL